MHATSRHGSKGDEVNFLLYNDKENLFQQGFFDKRILKKLILFCISKLRQMTKTSVQIQLKSTLDKIKAFLNTFHH